MRNGRSVRAMWRRRHSTASFPIRSLHRFLRHWASGSKLTRSFAFYYCSRTSMRPHPYAMQDDIRALPTKHFSRPPKKVWSPAQPLTQRCSKIFSFLFPKLKGTTKQNIIEKAQFSLFVVGVAKYDLCTVTNKTRRH